MQIFNNPNYNFIRWRWHAIALSVIVILAGVAMIATKGLPLGVDFKGGSMLILKFEQPVSEDAIRTALNAIPGDKTVQKYGAAGANEFLIRLPQSVAVEQGALLDKDVQAAKDAISAANIGKFDPVGTEVVGPVVGAQLQKKGLYATLFSILGITIYIGFRFRFSFALGAIAATFHDILVTIAFLTFFGYDLSLNVVAALLTITGYSVNDTIVIFDRVRENFRFMRKDSLEEVVNTSVNQTLARTIITAGTTFLAVLALFLFGGDVLKGFAFTMLVGIISGTYSTVFIAAAVAILLSKKKAEARSAGAPASADGKKVALADGKKNGKKGR